MAGASQAGYRKPGAALATAALLWLLGSAALADEAGGLKLAGAFDGCLADARIAAVKDHPETIQWQTRPPAPQPKKKKAAQAKPKDDLQTLCPELFAAIDGSAFALFLPDDWALRVTPRKLQRLRALMTAGDVEETAHRLDTGAIAGILDQMQTAHAARELSLWERFKAWLKAILEKKAGEPESSWFADWLKEHMPSDSVMTWIGYSLLALLLAGAGWIVYAELRAAGMLGARARRSKAFAGARGAATARSGTTLAYAGDEEQPALLIALLLEQLRRLGRIQDRLSMTHRELATAASFDSTADREIFSTLIAVAEKLRYAAMAPARAHLRQAIDSAKLLLARLLQPPRSTA